MRAALISAIVLLCTSASASIEREYSTQYDWPLPNGTYDWKHTFGPVWTPAECSIQRKMRDSESGFYMNDPEFEAKYRVWYRRLSECGF